jgi:hypothetical protein
VLSVPSEAASASVRTRSPCVGAGLVSNPWGSRRGVPPAGASWSVSCSRGRIVRFDHGLRASYPGYRSGVRAVLAITDLLARSRLQQAARAAGYEVSPARGVPAPEEAAPDVLVVDLDQPGTMEALGAWRGRHADVRVVGFAFHAHEALMAQARGLGVEVVTHGTTGRPERIFPVGGGPGVS